MSIITSNPYVENIEKGEFTCDTNLHHTHEGSIGNLCNEQIKTKYQEVLSGFDFEKVHQAIGNLLNSSE